MESACKLVPGVRIGIDLGGTKTEGVLLECTETGLVRVVERLRVPTPTEEGYEAVLQSTAQLVRQLGREVGQGWDNVPIGVGMPGGVRRVDGAVKNSNATCLNGRMFRSDLVQELGREVLFDNDANCFALAETLLGAGRAYREGVVFGAILGTGVGGGVVCGGSVWKGLQGIAGEWGHVQVYATPEKAVPTELRECYCGRRGCLETYVSGPSVEREYLRLTGRARSLAAIAGRRSEDLAAAASLEPLLEALGRGIAALINILDPSVVVLGGGVSNLDILYSEGVERVRAQVFNDELRTPIVRHELGDSAGVLGAALLGMALG